MDRIRPCGTMGYRSVNHPIRSRGPQRRRSARRLQEARWRDRLPERRLELLSRYHVVRRWPAYSGCYRHNHGRAKLHGYQNFQVANSSTSPLRVSIDVPGTYQTLAGVSAPIGGWAVDTSGAQILSVEILVDGLVNGTAIYGSSRGDVCAHYSSGGGRPNVGWDYQLTTAPFLASNRAEKSVLFVRFLRLGLAEFRDAHVPAKLAQLAWVDRTVNVHYSQLAGFGVDDHKSGERITVFLDINF